MIDIEELGIDFFRQLAGQTPAGICLIDEAGQYLFVNQALEEITGLSPSALMDAPSLSFFPPLEKEKAQRKADKSSEPLTSRIRIFDDVSDAPELDASKMPKDARQACLIFKGVGQLTGT